MIILGIILTVLLIASAIGGYRRLFRLDHLSQNGVRNGLLVAFCVLTIMCFANWIGWFPQPIAAKVTMALYVLAAGFFIGYALQLIRLRRQSGGLAYMYRSFGTDVAPNLIAVALFAFGVYRTSLFDWQNFTGIGITSGLSLIGFGFLGWTLRIIPEFRAKGILMLDQYIRWENMITWQWVDEETIQVDYYTASKEISEFKTYIPPEDQLIIERLLGKKRNEYEEKRKQLMLDEEES